MLLQPVDNNVTGYGHIRLPTTITIAHRSYMRSVHLKRTLKYIEKASIVARRLLHHNQYMRQYYSEHYIKDIQVHYPED